MADENQEQQVEQNVEAPAAGSEQVAQREYTDVEKKAMEQGWVPKEEYAGTGKWRDAEEFLDRGELFSKMDEKDRRIRALEGTVHEVKRHYKKMAEAEYNRALRALKAEKKDALDNGDSARVIEIDDEIATTKAQASQELQRLDQPIQHIQENPVFTVWQNRNPWYGTDRAMKIFADTLGEELVIKHRMTDEKQVLAEIERQVKKEFAHKFNNPNRDKPGAVEAGGKSSGRGADTFQLTPEETQVMNKFVKAKVMTKEEYIAEIKASRGA